jgi:hypothetical protein
VNAPAFLPPAPATIPADPFDSYLALPTAQMKDNPGNRADFNRASAELDRALGTVAENVAAMRERRS